MKTRHDNGNDDAYPADDQIRWADIEDLVFVPRRLLTGLQFADPVEFWRCYAWLSDQPDNYLETCAESLVIVVPKPKLQQVVVAGFHFSEVELLDLETMPADEARHIQRELIQEGMAILRQRLASQS